MAVAAAMDPAQVFISEVMARNKGINEATEPGDSIVQQFYSGAAVFVTGGSGFLGKQLIEKLLRATKVSKVFVLLRPKKGKMIEERLIQLLQDPVFDILREQQPDFADRITVVPGDMAELRLGMDDKDWNTVADQVNIVFNVAASTRFEGPLRAMTMINLRGTREALLLGKACTKLRSFIHVSSAFVSCSQPSKNGIESKSKLLEDFHQSPIDPEIMIKLAETMEEERLNDVTPSDRFCKQMFTKAVAEDMVRTMAEDLPVCVVRPAFVISSIQEPQPGWLDESNIYGASFLCLGIGLGLMHTALVDLNSKVPAIPVDYVNNATIAAGWETANRWTAGKVNPKVYTVTSTSRNPGFCRDLLNLCSMEILRDYPSPRAVAHSLCITTKSSVMYWIYTWLLHLIPAYIIDGVCLLIGKKRRFVHLYSKMYNMSALLTYFIRGNWDFVDDNTADLYDSLSVVDQKIFDFDVKKINWREFVILWSLGIRKYLIKDRLVNTEYAKKKQFFLKCFTYAAYAIYFYLLYKIVYLFIYLLSMQYFV